MKVVLAQHAGFCMGVRRAVEATLAMVEAGLGPIATFGPLIHNPQVLELLAKQGVTVLDRIPARASGSILIRAHGVPPAQKRQLEATGARVEDATCPRVMKVQAIIGKYRRQGYATVIVGDRDHAEVAGLMGYAGSEGQVVNSLAEAEALSISPPYIVVSQTTQDEALFQAIKELILKRFPGGKVFNTICDSTHKRQQEVRSLCRQVDALVVVGGRASANTRRLGEIAENLGRPVFMIETVRELRPDDLRGYQRVGVTAGASTPNWVIQEVVEALEAEGD